MMDLDSAIQHCKEKVQEQAKKGCYSCAEEHQQLADWLKELKAYREQGGDAISRQAVLDIINFEDKWLLGAKSHNVDTKTAFWTMKSKIFNLPSTTPQQRSGRWIDDEFGSKCSCCGIHTHLDKFDRPMKFKCCSMCGAKMEV